MVDFEELFNEFISNKELVSTALGLLVLIIVIFLISKLFKSMDTVSQKWRRERKGGRITKRLISRLRGEGAKAKKGGEEAEKTIKYDNAFYRFYIKARNYVAMVLEEIREFDLKHDKSFVKELNEKIETVGAVLEKLENNCNIGIKARMDERRTYKRALSEAKTEDHDLKSNNRNLKRQLRSYRKAKEGDDLNLKILLEEQIDLNSELRALNDRYIRVYEAPIEMVRKNIEFLKSVRRKAEDFRNELNSAEKIKKKEDIIEGVGKFMTGSASKVTRMAGLDHEIISFLEEIDRIIAAKEGILRRIEKLRRKFELILLKQEAAEE